MFACLYSSSASQENLLALASLFSPLVESTAPGVVVFSIVGLGRMFGAPQEIAAVVARKGAEAGIQANLAVSVDPDTAVIAARNKKGLTLIPEGREAARLGELPVEVLESVYGNPLTFVRDSRQAGGPAGERERSERGANHEAQARFLEILGTLDRWGIQTLGELAELPELGFIARFGEDGMRLMRLARGETRRSLRAVQPPENYERRVEFDHPQALLEPLSFALSSLLGELTEALDRQGLATNRVKLDLHLAGRAGEEQDPHRRVLEFPVPVRDPKVILKQLQFDLEAHPPKSAIVGVNVALNPVEPKTLQHGLFTPQAPTPDKLQFTLARLTALAGEGNVGSPYLLDTHRRDAFRMRPFMPEQGGESEKTDVVYPRYSFRFYRPPRLARVKLQKEKPLHVASEANTGNVVAAAGPWKSSGNWWSQEAWAREEWDVELSNGGVYRLYLALASERTWFLEGVYD